MFSEFLLRHFAGMEPQRPKLVANFGFAHRLTPLLIASPIALRW
jgi:hypothetical protein